jgi:hypothetical protein
VFPLERPVGECCACIPCLTSPFFTPHLFYAFLLQRPLPKYTTSQILPSHFQLNAFWLAAHYYANPYMLHGCLWEYYFWFLSTFSGTQLWRKARVWCTRKCLYIMTNTEYMHKMFGRTLSVWCEAWWCMHWPQGCFVCVCVSPAECVWPRTSVNKNAVKITHPTPLWITWICKTTGLHCELPDSNTDGVSG